MARTHVKEFLDEWWSCGKPPRHAYGRIEVWFKYACDGRPDRVEEPWRAPAWALRGCSQSRAGRPFRTALHPREPTVCYRAAGWTSATIFRNALDAAEHEVRSDLALKKSKPANKNQVGCLAAGRRVKGRWHQRTTVQLSFAEGSTRSPEIKAPL